MKFQTLCLHAAHNEDPKHAHLTPVYASSTYSFESTAHAEALFQGKDEGYVYGRFGSPNSQEVEQRVAALECYDLTNEKGEALEAHALLHSSGMAAITTLFMANVKAGDKIITHHSLYGGTQELLDKILPPLGVTYITVDFKNLDAVSTQIENDAAIKMMYLETPANPTLQCFDLEKLIVLAHHHKLLTACDNTFATPYLQQPFQFGADFIVHSTTKFLNGHGTAVGGLLIGRNIAHMKTKVTKTHRLLGGNSNAWDAFLLLNGIKTLPLRMKQHCANADAIADYLSSHHKVDWVNYLGLKDHPDYELAHKQMKHAGAVLSFELKGGIEAGRIFLNHVHLMTHAVSLGTCDTIVTHPASTTHAGVPLEMRRASGITDGLIRMSVGLEDAEDLIADIAQALEKVPA